MENIAEKPFETIEDFIADYFKLRDQQKKYFQLRFMEDLNRAKKMESELDKKCMNYIKSKAQQPNENQTKLF